MRPRNYCLLACFAMIAAMTAGCSLAPSNATPLQTAQVYGDDLSNAVSAAAVTYETGPPPATAAQKVLVDNIVSNLQTARAALDAATTPTDAKDAANLLLANINSLEPYADRYLGPAAEYIPLAIAVVQSFIDAAAPPPNATPTPPAALHRAGMKFHATRRTAARQPGGVSLH
jgi:hypothetical protein